ncbi:MAG: hypothetical protein E7167_02650 [Firmicutes bacterium]|nr:hypothetical protein [Bacillota bacterium]
MYSEICELPALLQSIYIIKLVLKVIFVLVPIFLLYKIMKDIFSEVLNDGEFKNVAFKSIKRLILGAFIFFVPTIFGNLISLADYNDKLYRLNMCYDNANLEDISYFKSLETVENAVRALERTPIESNLKYAQNALLNITPNAREDTVLDFQARITKAKVKVDEVNKMIECKNKGGMYKSGYCEIIPLEDNSSPGDDSPSNGDNPGSEYNPSPGNGKLVSYDSEYMVVESGISVKKFVSTMRSKGIYQAYNSSKYSGYCLSFAYFHAYALYTGNTSGTADTGMKYTRASHFTSYDNDNKQEVLKIIYSELTQGKPVVLQVNGNKAGTSRHYVTVIGMKKSVRSGSTMKDTDLLIFDAHQGTVRKIGTKGSGNRFLVTGAACRKKYSGYQIYYLD